MVTERSHTARNALDTGIMNSAGRSLCQLHSVLCDSSVFMTGLILRNASWNLYRLKLDMYIMPPEIVSVAPTWTTPIVNTSTAVAETVEVSTLTLSQYLKCWSWNLVPASHQLKTLENSQIAEMITLTSIENLRRSSCNLVLISRNLKTSLTCAPKVCKIWDFHGGDQE
jgi:hypothetical protein